MKEILVIVFIIFVFAKVVLFAEDVLKTRKKIRMDEEDMEYWNNKYDGM